MAVQKTEVNPFARRPLGTRIADGGRYVLRIPVEAYYGYRHWSRPLRLTVASLCVLATIFATYSGVQFYLKKSTQNAIRRELASIDNEIRTTGDTTKIIAGLDRILELSPNDDLARRRKVALETGEGDPSDPPLMMFLFREHQKKGAVDKLIREAQKRLDFERRDYYAHYLLAIAKLQKKDMEGARPHLIALGNPEGHPVNLQFDAIAWSMQVLGQAGQDTSRLRSFTAENIWKMIQAEHLTNEQPSTQWMFLYLFGETFELPKLPPNTWGAWPAGRKLSELCYDGAKEKGDVNTLAKLATLGPRYADAVVKMHLAKQISDEQKAELAAEVEDRTRRAWTYVIEKEPKTADAYLGLMMSYARSGKNREAVDTLMRGLEACGDNPQLLERFSHLAILNDKEIDAYNRLKQAAERNPDFPKYWVIAANAAYADGRRGLAMEALEKARAAMPNEMEVVCMQATFITGTGHPEKVLHYLSVIPDEQIVTMPRVALIFTRALAEIGDDERLDHFLAKVMEFSLKASKPEPALQAATGLQDATPPTMERAAKTSEFLMPIIERWKIEYPAASQIQAAALSRVCELKPGPVDPLLAREAVLACEKSLAVRPDHLPTVTSLVLWRILGDKDPFKAMTEAAPLAENVNRLLPEQAEVLAMAYNANARHDEAFRTILPHTKSRPTAGCWIQMAFACLGQRRHEEARAALDNAQKLKKSDREHVDYLRARELFSKAAP